MALDIPEGVGTLTLIEDFITPYEASNLLGKIVRGITHAPARRSVLLRNIVQRWGSPVPYSTNIISADIPEHFEVLIDRLMEQNLVSLRPDSVTMNQYLAGQAILAHVDDPKGGPVITVLSLVTPARLIFRKRDKSFTVDLPPRSLVQMRDEIRYNWTQELEPVADTRYSLVFRCSQDIQQ